MAHIHRGGTVDQVVAPVKLTSSVPTSLISVGDLVAFVSGAVVPATAFTWDTDKATTQTGFAAAFLGVSASRSRLGSTDARDLSVIVNQDGNVEMDAASATYAIGSYVGPGASGSALIQTVEAVTTKAKAIGVVVRDDSVTATTRVLVRLLNTITKR